MKSWRIPTEVVAIVAILSFALGLRLWGAYFGLPHIYHPDEGFEVYRALRLGTGGFDFERVSKGGYYFILFLEYGVYFMIQRVTGVINSANEFAAAFVHDPSPFWKIGRVTTAIMGTMTVALVWLQGRRIGGKAAGLFAALFLAASFQHVVDSHTITVDVPMTLFSFWAVFMIAEDAAGRRRLNPFLFSLVAAFAILNKIPAVLVFVPYFLGAWMRGGLRGPRGLITRATLMPVVLAGILFVLANPGFILHFGGMLNLFTHTVGGGGLERSVEYTGVPLRTNLWQFYGDAVVRSQGPAVIGLAILGTFLGLARRRREIILHAAFAALYFVAIAISSSSHLYYPRYIMPILPGACLLAGYALNELLDGLRLSQRLALRFAIGVAILLAIEPSIASVRWDLRLSRVDTRTQALEWMEDHAAGGSRVLLEGFPEETAQLSIPLHDSPQNVQAMIERLRSTDPGKAMFWEMNLKAKREPFYDLVAVRQFEDWLSLEETRARGIEWIVLRRDYFQPDNASLAKFSRSAIDTRSEFYRQLSLAPDAQRVASFDADPDGAPGYDLEIWRLLASSNEHSLLSVAGAPGSAGAPR